MADKALIPYNDVFFYGLALCEKENNDIRQDIFSNILMRYLRTLKPVSSKLYRTSNGDKYEYSYSFVPGKPIYWRVIRNRRIIEEVEQLSDGKYCLNYYDDQGKDLKRVHFSSQHKWLKTNYYNSVYGTDLICSIVPKEVNAQTVIVKYITGVPYPVVLHCCKQPSCDEVNRRVSSRAPEPDLVALTNYGILSFVDEKAINIYNQILAEEEEKYAEENKPEVFTTAEDIAGGFCFTADSFDSAKNVGSTFDLTEASELTDEGFGLDETPVIVVPTEIADESDISSFSVDAELAQAINMITSATDIDINKELVFAGVTDTSATIDSVEVPVDNDNVAAKDSVQQDEIDNSVIERILDGNPVDIDLNLPKENIIEQDSTNEKTPDMPGTVEAVEQSLLPVKDDDIDDYVQNLIDSMLHNAREAVFEYTVHSEEGFAGGATEAAVEKDSIAINNATAYISDNAPDVTIESNGAEYFYYGETDENGKRSGHGRTLMSDGKTAYDGCYLDDKRHGVGSFYYKDGSLCYWGHWQENLRNGFGLGISSDTGLTHVGNWKNNKPVGIGARFDKDGRFLYIDSACERVNGGIRVTGFTENSLIVEVWDEKTLKTIKKEIYIEDLLM